MNSTKSNTLFDQLSNSISGVLRLGRVRIGRIDFGEVLISGREAAINWQEMLDRACEKTKRFRVRKDGTRYPEPLPMGTPARSLSIEIDDYLGDMKRRGLKDDTIRKTARSLQFLKLACGDIPVSRIDHTHIYTLWDLLRWASPELINDLPVNTAAKDIIKRGKELAVPAPAVATMELHRRFLTSFFNRLVKMHAIPFSPMEPFGEMKKDLAVDPNKVQRFFTDYDLRTIFEPTKFIPWASKFPHRWWAPILGLYTGARINEIAQLKVTDIIDERGTWCLSIRKTVDEDLKGRRGAVSRQSLKGRSAVRTIPISQAVLDAGFLDFVADMREFGHPRLFPHLSAGVNRETGETNARYSQGLLNQFGSYLKGIGFPKGLGFHAFRHTLATDLDNQGVREEDVALITGHSVSKRVPVLHSNYYHPNPEAIRTRQARALSQYKPKVQLPGYRRGQFASRLKTGVKVYP